MYKHAISLTCTGVSTAGKTVAELREDCPSVTPGINGNYFSIASNDRLGVAQDHQFQVEETGNIWGSYYSDVDGVKTKDTSSVKNNEYAEMPRELYTTGYNYPRGHYNAYAATAETGKYTTRLADVADSICPAGWKLPSNFTNLRSAYGWTDSTAGSEMLATAPLNFQFTGEYVANNGSLSYAGSRNYLFTTRAYGSSDWITLYRSGQRVMVGSNEPKIHGYNIRCVKRDDPISEP